MVGVDSSSYRRTRHSPSWLTWWVLVWGLLASRVESSLDICCQRQTRCTVTTAPDDGTRHPQLQPALSSAGTDKWVLSWRLNEESDSSGDRRAVGSRFQALAIYAPKLRWPVDVRVAATWWHVYSPYEPGDRTLIVPASSQDDSSNCYQYKCKKLNSLQHLVRTTVAGSHN